MGISRSDRNDPACYEANGMLTAEYEHKLATLWWEQKDRRAWSALIEAHKPLARKLAKKFSGYCQDGRLELEDLVSVAYVGLIEAANRFCPAREVRFSTYAAWWVKANVTNHILHNYSIVRFGGTEDHKKLFYGLARARKAVEDAFGSDLSEDEFVKRIAEHLDVSVEHTRQMNRRLRGSDVSLNDPMRAQEDGESDEFIVSLVDAGPSPEAAVIQSKTEASCASLIHRAMETLDDRERLILQRRRLTATPETLEDIGIDLGLTRERVRQIEAKALDKLRKVVTRRIGKPQVAQHYAAA